MLTYTDKKNNRCRCIIALELMRALTYKQEVGIRHVNVNLENLKKRKRKKEMPNKKDMCVVKNKSR